MGHTRSVDTVTAFLEVHGATGRQSIRDEAARRIAEWDAQPHPLGQLITWTVNGTARYGWIVPGEEWHTPRVQVATTTNGILDLVDPEEYTPAAEPGVSIVPQPTTAPAAAEVLEPAPAPDTPPRPQPSPPAIDRGSTDDADAATHTMATNYITGAEAAKVVATFATDADLEAAGFRYGAEGAKLGDVAVIWGRNGLRRGIVTKVGRLNVEVQFTTPSAIKEAANLRYGWSEPQVTAKSAKFADVAILAPVAKCAECDEPVFVDDAGDAHERCEAHELTQAEAELDEAAGLAQLDALTAATAVAPAVPVETAKAQTASADGGVDELAEPKPRSWQERITIAKVDGRLVLTGTTGAPQEMELRNLLKKHRFGWVQGAWRRYGRGHDVAARGSPSVARRGRPGGGGQGIVPAAQLPTD